MAGIKAGSAGRLSIEIVAEIARLQQDLDRAKRAVKAASGDIARNAGAANDSFVKMGGGAGVAAAGVNTLSKAALLASTALAGIGISNVVGGIIEANRSFQSLSASLKVATGSVEAASAAYAKLQDFAEQTPFGIEQSVQAFLKLKNLGLDPSVEAMRSYGNTASSMGKDLMQMIEAVADAATGEFERLKEFGIKTSVEGEKVSFTFQGVTTTIGKNAAEIEKYLQNIGNVQFAGAMDEQMKTLNGQFANFEDSLASLYVAIGNLGASSALAQMLSAASDAVIFLNDNLETIVNVLGAGAIAFGTYKAAMLASVAVNALMSGSLGIMIATTATTTAQFGVLAGAQVAYTAATSGAAAATRAFTAALINNPATAAAVAIAALAAGVYLYTQRANEGTAAQERHAQQSRTLSRIESELSGELSNVAKATGAAKDAALARIQVLRTQAAEAVRAARAEAVLAAVQAGRRAQELAAAVKVEGRGNLTDMATAGTGVLPMNVQNSVNAERALRAQKQAAFDAGKAWREAEQKLSSFDKMIEDATKPIQLAATATGDLGKKTRGAGKDMSEAATAAEEWAKALEKLRTDVAVDVSKSADLSGWLAEWERMVDREWQAMQDGIKEKRQGAENIAKFEQDIAEQQRRKALAAAYEIADILGGAWGDLVGTLADAIIPLVDVSSNLGKTLEAFTKGAVLGGAVGGVTGSSAGGAIGGGFGQVAGEELTKNMTGLLGKFGGPLGAIAGGLIGGIIGGLMKSTPRASATVSIIAGQAMETAVKGNSGKLKSIAGEMASGLIAGLEQIATSLGAELAGNASVSVGVRNGNYRVDPTGQGITKTSKGAIDFGDDKAAANAYAMLVAIRQLDFTGVSASVKTLLTLTDDLETNLAKVEQFQSVFADLAKRDDPAKYAQDEITKWHDAMAKIFAEAGATADELAALERLTGLKRADAVAEAAEKIATAEREAQDRLREIRDKNVELLQAQGKVEEAEAMARQARIDDAPEYLRAIQQQIETANLLREAEEKLAETRALAKQNAQEMFSLQQRLYGAQGNDAMVQRLQRENELRQATSALVRQELLRIYAAEDLTSETARLTAEAEKLAEKQKAAADQARDLAIQIAELENPELARLMRLADERALIEDVNLAAFDRLQVLKAEAEQAAETKRLAEEALAAQKEIADEIDGLNRQWLELTGQTQTLRDMDLALLKSDEARRIQRAIWDYNDALEAQKAAQEAATAAMEDYAKRLDEVRNTLVSAYERESSALQSTIDKFRDFSATIKEFRDGLIGTSNPAFGLAQAQATFANTSRMAGLGNEASLSSFTGDAQAYLDAVRSSGTYEQYQRAMASVLAGSNGAIKASDGMASMAQQQLDRMTGIMETLGLIREDNVSFNDALTGYNKMLVEEAIPHFTETVSTSIDNMGRKIDDAAENAQRSSDKAQVALETSTIALNRIERLLSRMERDGSFAVTLDGEQVQIDPAANTVEIGGVPAVFVTNNPLPVDQV